MVVAFAGWPDAAEAATRALRYLARKLGAKKFAEIDPEEFYDFTLVRPRTRVNRQGERVIRWPRNDFYQVPGDANSDGLLLYVGTETGVGFPLDNGQSWQRLQTNSPVVPVYDIKVKEEDLVAATHGCCSMSARNLTCAGEPSPISSRRSPRKTACNS